MKLEYYSSAPLHYFQKVGNILSKQHATYQRQSSFYIMKQAADRKGAGGSEQ